MSSDMMTSTNTGSGMVLKDYDYTDGIETYNGQLIHWFKAIDPTFYNKDSYKLLVNSQSVSLAPGHDYEMNFFTGLSWKGEYTVTIRIVGHGDVFTHDYKCTETSYTNVTRVRFTAPDSLSNFSRFIIEISVPEKYQYGSAGENARFMISENFELQDRTDNPSWLYKILKKFDDIGDWFDNLGRSISSGFTALGNKIGGFFDSLKESIGNWFSDVGKWFKEQGEKIQAFSDGVKQWFQDLGDKIGGFFTDLYNDLIEGLKSLFIPSEGYFDAYMEKTKIWAAARFGFLYTAADLMSSMVTDLQGLLRDDFSFVLPAAKFTLNGTTYTLWEAYTLPMGELLQNNYMNYAYGLYKTLLGSACAFALFKYAQHVFDKVMAN